MVGLAPYVKVRGDTSSMCEAVVCQTESSIELPSLAVACASILADHLPIGVPPRCPAPSLATLLTYLLRSTADTIERHTVLSLLGASPDCPKPFRLTRSLGTAAWHTQVHEPPALFVHSSTLWLRRSRRLRRPRRLRRLRPLILLRHATHQVVTFLLANSASAAWRRVRVLTAADIADLLAPSAMPSMAPMISVACMTRFTPPDATIRGALIRAAAARPLCVILTAPLVGWCACTTLRLFLAGAHLQGIQGAGG